MNIAINIFNEEIYNENGQLLVNFCVHNKFRINKQHKYNFEYTK